VTGWTSDSGQNVLRSSIKTRSSSSPRYCHIFFLIAFLDEAYIRYIKVILCVNYIIIICINNNDAIINNNYRGLRDLILVFKIHICTRKDLYENYKQYGHALSNWFASPPLCGQRYPGPCVYFKYY
jgi:hypothetical protein